MDAGVDDEADGAEELGVEAAVVADGVLVEADLFAELLGVEGPAFGVGAEAGVKAELRQALELLLDRELHVMAGDAFVVGDGLVFEQGAVGEVAGGDADAAGAFAVGCAGLIVGGVGGLEDGNGFDGDGAAGDEGEELREFGLHLRDVAAVVVEDLLGGGGDPLGIVVDGGAEGGQILEARIVGEARHLGGDAGDFVEAESVDLFGREVCGGAAEDVVLVALRSVGQRGDGEVGAAVRGVVGRDEGGEGTIGGDDVLVDGVR